MSENDRTETIGEPTKEHFYHTYMINFEIIEINDDTKLVFQYSSDSRDDKTAPIIAHGVYDYNQAILYSSLSYMSEDSFLDHMHYYMITTVKLRKSANKNILHIMMTIVNILIGMIKLTRQQ